MTAAAPDVEAEPARRGLHLPSAYTILFILIVAVAIATWIIPAGRYDYNEDGTPIPGTYHAVEQNPARIIVDSLTAPINGMYGITGADGSINYYNSGELFGAIDVALFILVIGGFLGVTMQTGAIQTGITRVVERLRGRERLLIPILMALFALGGTSYGMAEESLAFYVLVITVMVAAGYDSLTGAAILLLGCGIGVIGSTINPFATGIASGFAGTGIDEGLIGRLVILVVGTAFGIWWVMRYAARIKADPARSLIAGDRAEIDAHFAAGSESGAASAITGRQKVVLGPVLPRLHRDDHRRRPVGGPRDPADPHPLLVVPGDDGVIPAFSILVGSRGTNLGDELRRGLRQWARATLLGVALIIGIARGVTVIMTNGQITDTILNAAEQAVSGLGGVAFINLMFGLFLPLSFLIPSSSGLATVAMPIMAPLASFANVPPELVVTAYQTGNGLVNLVTPTSAVVMGGLAIARVGYGTWLKFVWPLLVILAILCMAVMSIAVLLG